jgi:hypothetical protein
MQLESWESMRGTAIECRRCGATGPTALTEDEALTWWNEAPRPSSAKIMKQRGRYKSRLQSMKRQLAREEAENKRERERIEAPKRKREREFREWASEREAWLRAPVDEDTIQ